MTSCVTHLFGEDEHDALEHLVSAQTRQREEEEEAVEDRLGDVLQRRG